MEEYTDTCTLSLSLPPKPPFLGMLSYFLYAFLGKSGFANFKRTKYKVQIENVLPKYPIKLVELFKLQNHTEDMIKISSNSVVSYKNFAV